MNFKKSILTSYFSLSGIKNTIPNNKLALYLIFAHFFQNSIFNVLRP